jgi:hypothetical protein
MKIAGVMQVRDYNKRCRAFPHLKHMTDMTIVFDDGSVCPFNLEADITLRRGMHIDRWNCTANLTTLFYWAHVMGADWIVRLDDDMILGEGLRTREDIESLIIDNIHADIINVRLYDLWGEPGKQRIDGVWGQKQFPLVTKNWFRYPNATLPDPNRRLHNTIFASNVTPHTRKISDRRIYHTGCMTFDQRVARVKKYEYEDANGEFQSDYSYILSEEGLMTSDVPSNDMRYIRPVLLT